MSPKLTKFCQNLNQISVIKLLYTSPNSIYWFITNNIYRWQHFIPISQRISDTYLNSFLIYSVKYISLIAIFSYLYGVLSILILFSCFSFFILVGYDIAFMKKRHALTDKLFCAYQKPLKHIACVYPDNMHLSKTLAIYVSYSNIVSVDLKLIKLAVL